MNDLSKDKKNFFLLDIHYIKMEKLEKEKDKKNIKQDKINNQLIIY